MTFSSPDHGKEEKKGMCKSLKKIQSMEKIYNKGAKK